MDERYLQDEVRAIGKRLRDIQLSKGLINKEMEGILSISHSSYQSYKNGDRKMSLSTLLLLRDEIQPNMNYLFYGIDPDQKIIEDFDLKVKKVYSYEEISKVLFDYLSSVPEAKRPYIIGRLQIMQSEFLMQERDV